MYVIAILKKSLYLNVFVMYRCDEGFKGVECEPTSHLKDQMQADFGIRYEPDIDFEHIRGGKVVHSNQGCGTIFADESLYFFDVRIVHCCWCCF